MNGHAARAALLLALVAGCELKDPPGARTDPGAQTQRSAAGSVTDSGAAPALADTPLSTPPLSTPAPAVADTFKPLDVVVLPIKAPPVRPSAGTLVANADELLALRTGIVVPVSGVAVTSLRDMYDEPRGTRVHEALDIPAPRGTPVVSATAGRVLRLHESKAGGLMVYAADVSDRFILLYAHLDAYAPGLAPGTVLAAGQKIGTVGTTGNAPPQTPHLHFAVLRGRPSEAWWRGTATNPYPLFRP